MGILTLQIEGLHGRCLKRFAGNRLSKNGEVFVQLMS